MPAAAVAVAAVAAATASVAAAVGAATVALIAGVVSSIATVVATLTSNLRNNIIAVGAAIMGAMSQVGTALSRFITQRTIGVALDTLNRDAWRQIVKAGLVTQAEARAYKVYSAISAFNSAVLGRPLEFLTSAIDLIENLKEYNVEGIKRAVAHLLPALEQINISAVGHVVAGIRGAGDYLQKLHALTQIARAEEEKKPIKAIYLGLDYIDKAYAVKFEELTYYVDTKIREADRAVSQILRLASDVANEFYTFADAWTEISADIAKELGVKEIRNIADGIRKFRDDLRNYVLDNISEVRRYVRDVFSAVSHPVSTMIWQIYEAKRDLRRFRRLWQEANLTHLIDSIKEILEPQRRLYFIRPKLVALPKARR